MSHHPGLITQTHDSRGLELPTLVGFRQERLASNDAPTLLALLLLFGCSQSGTDDNVQDEVLGVDRRDKQESPCGTVEEHTGTSCKPDSSSSGDGVGLRKAREFMAKIRPKEEGSSGPSWQDLQLEPTPTLLPNMR